MTRRTKITLKGQNDPLKKNRRPPEGQILQKKAKPTKTKAQRPLRAFCVQPGNCFIYHKKTSTGIKKELQDPSGTETFFHLSLVEANPQQVPTLPQYLGWLDLSQGRSRFRRCTVTNPEVIFNPQKALRKIVSGEVRNIDLSRNSPYLH